MHSTYQRASNILSHVSTAFMVLLSLVALSTMFLHTPLEGSVEVKSLQLYVPSEHAVYMGHGQDEYGFTRFDINADLKPLFNWNTKQVFAYLVVDYTASNNATNSIVVWDRIVRRQADAHLRLSEARSKYTLKAIGGSFTGAAPAEFRLMYNVMPWVGLLKTGEAARVVSPVDWPEPKKNVK